MIALGEPATFGNWTDYSTIGITKEHVPQLLELMTTMDYHESYDQIEIWIPLHAWRALAQLRELSMLRPFANLLMLLEDDDWSTNDTPRVVELLGPVALADWFQILDQFEADGQSDSGNGILEGITTIGKKHLETRHYVADEFSRRLEHHTDLDEGYNGFLVLGLCELRVKSALPVISAAFAADSVDDLCVIWEEVIEAFALPTSTRPKYYLK